MQLETDKSAVKDSNAGHNDNSAATALQKFQTELLQSGKHKESVPWGQVGIDGHGMAGPEDQHLYIPELSREPNRPERQKTETWGLVGPDGRSRNGFDEPYVVIPELPHNHK